LISNKPSTIHNGEHSVKAYLITTGVVFAIVAILHMWEMIDRGHPTVEDPFVLLVTAGLSIWAWRLTLRRA